MSEFENQVLIDSSFTDDEDEIDTGSVTLTYSRPTSVHPDFVKKFAAGWPQFSFTGRLGLPFASLFSTKHSKDSLPLPKDWKKTVERLAQPGKSQVVNLTMNSEYEFGCESGLVKDSDVEEDSDEEIED
ncbi:MAG: hypothetical protein COT74_02160 [Bdellovibrionales bacterium CG10_big_fil_rev_8_21_14_0_10_45_34]|nr:MAG: hypothetical protein COT74_02160 [Bdellovibrionales bacterium CG10_big_fil_rev_8_21_14_0_10_45_34]